MIVFLCGSKTICTLPDKLTALLDSYCAQNCEFIVGDCYGADILMQRYLHGKGYPHVTVYVSGEHVRQHVSAYPVRHFSVPDGTEGFALNRQKDIAMVLDCDEAIMLWNGKTHGTRCNIEDMKRAGKPYTVIRV